MDNIQVSLTNRMEIKSQSTGVFLLLLSALIGPGIGYGKFYLFHFSLLITGFIFIIQTIENDYIIPYVSLNTKHILMFVFWITWSIISLGWSLNMIEGLKYLIFILFGTICVYAEIVYLKNRNRLFKILHGFGYVITINIILAIIESFGVFRWPLSPFSEYIHFFGRSSEELNNSGFLAALGIIPPTGLFGNPNNLAVLCAMSIPFYLIFAKGLHKFFGISGIVWIILTTGSRGALAASILGVCFFMVFIKKRFRETIIIIIVVICISIFGIILFLNGNKLIISLFQNVNIFSIFFETEGEDIFSSGIRMKLMLDAWESFINTNGLGLGGGGSMVLQEQYGGYSGGIVRLHNFWLEMLVEGGVILFGVFIIWLARILVNLYSIGRRYEEEYLRMFANSIFISILIFIPAIISVSTAIYYLPMWLLFGFAISIINLSKEK